MRKSTILTSGDGKGAKNGAVGKSSTKLIMKGRAASNNSKVRSILSGNYVTKNDSKIKKNNFNYRELIKEKTKGAINTRVVKGHHKTRSHIPYNGSRTKSG